MYRKNMSVEQGFASLKNVSRQDTGTFVKLLIVIMGRFWSGEVLEIQNYYVSLRIV